MQRYRIFLLDHYGSIQGREEFDALNDTEAAKLGGLVFDACCDMCSAYQIWRGSWCVTTWVQGMRGVSSLGLSEQLQALARNTEEQLSNSHQNVARSRRLLARLNDRAD